jgi:hypothetical protein
MSDAKFIDAITTAHIGKLCEAQLRRQARSQVQLGNEGNCRCYRRIQAQPEGSDSAQENFIDITPRPIFPRLKGSNDGMRGGVKMFRGVAIRRRVTAADMSARQAKSQVDPGRTDLQTFLTPVRAGNDISVNLIEVRAFFEAHNVILFAM